MFLIRRMAVLGCLWAFFIPSSFAGESEPNEEKTPPAERPRLQYWLRDPSPSQPAPAGALDVKKDARISAATVEPEAEPRSVKVAPDEGGRTSRSFGAGGKREWRAPETPANNREKSADIKATPASSDAMLNRAVQHQYKMAKEAYGKKDFDRCASICRNILIVSPRFVEAAELLRKTQERNYAADAGVVKAAAERRDMEGILEVEERSIRPPPLLPEIRPRLPRREDDPMASRIKEMSNRLSERVEIDFMDAELEWVFNVLFKMTGINFIAVPDALSGKTLTMHVKDIPLREVLDFVVRTNDGLQYTVTENAVWLTATSKDDLKELMIPRVYPIHHGLTSTVTGSGSSSSSSSGSGGGGGGGGGSGGSSSGSENSYLEILLKWVEEAEFPQMFPPGSKYILDYQTNQLLVVTTTEGHEQFEKLLDVFDEPPIQVAIRARFLEIRSGANEKFGLNLTDVKRRDLTSGTEAVDASDTRGQRNPFHTYQMASGLADLSSISSGISLVLKGVRTDPMFSVQLDLLLNKNRSRVLSEPYILAINNKTAIITIDTQFRYISDITWQEVRDYTNPEGSINYTQRPVPQWSDETVGFELNVTPSVGRNLKTINLHIAPKVDSLHGAQQIENFQVSGIQVDQVIPQPTIDRTELETDVVLEDNGYVIIGGLHRLINEKVEKRIPGLSRIPGIGRLFKSTKSESTISNLVIVLEAQIITPRGRTYRKDPRPDEVDIREGGVGYPMGAVTGYGRSEAINSALGLTDKDDEVRRLRELFEARAAEEKRSKTVAPPRWSKAEEDSN
jgi:type II secretory pathway component GspD/PulD (secretin)